MADHASSQPVDAHQLGKSGDTIANAALLVAVLGVAASLLIGALGDGGWDRLEQSYLTAFIFVTTISLGALFWTMIQHATRAGWGVVSRRVCENVAGNLTVLVPILFIPVLIAMWFGHLYHHWSDPALVDPNSSYYDPVIDHKSPYLNKPFWVFRAILFLGIWSFLAWFFRRHSVDQDATGDVAHTHRMQALAPVGLVLFALTLTFASIDWVKSINSHWFSTMFGVYFFAAACTGFFSVQIIAVFLLQKAGKLKEFTVEHYQDAGKLLFAFGMVFWAYIAFSQYVLIWYANLPEETTWYGARMLGGWQGVTIFLLLAHFIVPFVLFISKWPKRFAPTAVIMAGWMLLIHYIDMYWLVMPMTPPSAMWNEAGESFSNLRVITDAAIAAGDEKYAGFSPSLMDLTCLLALGGLMVNVTIRRFASAALHPVHDPRLHESLAFENM
ncbi:MAG: quinol:cytochrome C oxidoreductase [Planctomycetota bacterium]